MLPAWAKLLIDNKFLDPWRWSRGPYLDTTIGHLQWIIIDSVPRSDRGASAVLVLGRPARGTGSPLRTLLESPVSALTPKGIGFLMGRGQTDIRMSIDIVGRVVSGPVGRSTVEVDQPL